MSRKTSDFFKNVLKAVIPLLIGVLILWWIYRDINIHEMGAVLEQGIIYEWIGFSLILVGLGHVIRGIRWKQLLTPLGKTPKTSSTIHAVFANYLINLILPRLGEVSRCGLISKYEGIPFTKVLGTLITERIIDLLSLGMVILLAFLLNWDALNAFFQRETNLASGILSFFSSKWLYIGLAALVIICITMYKFFRQTLFMQKIIHAIKNMAAGIKTIKFVNNKLKFIGLTLCMWIVYYFEFYVCCFAFPFTENITIIQALFIFVMANIGIVVPVQGGIGPWHFMVIQCLILFGIKETEAGTFALIVHTTQMIMTALLGLWGLLMLHLNNKKKAS